jgi:hypothetical protein
MKNAKAVRLIKIVWPATLAGLHTMPHDRACTARQICGPTVWNSLTNGEQKYAGRVLRAIVALGYIPLQHARESSQHHLRYVKL